MCIKQYDCVNQSNFLSVRLPHSTLTHRILIRAKITIPREDYYDYCLWWIHTSPDEEKTNRFGSEEKCELLHFYVIKVPKEHIDWAWIWVKWMGFSAIWHGGKRSECCWNGKAKFMKFFIAIVIASIMHFVLHFLAGNTQCLKANWHIPPFVYWFCRICFPSTWF